MHEVHGRLGLVAGSEFILILVVVTQILFLNSQAANEENHKAYRCEF